MSDTTTPAADATAQDVIKPTPSEPTHDAFQAPLAPEIIDGAAINKTHAEVVQQALAALQTGETTLQGLVAQLADAPGHKVVAGARVALGRALAALQAEKLAVQDEIARRLPAGL